MEINAILACDNAYCIGNKNRLPWPRNNKDMMWFRDHTLNHTVLMGRSTWESIGSKPLETRINIVMSRNKDISGDMDMVISGDMDKILETVKSFSPHSNIWIIGGADIYRQAIQYCDNLYLTRFHQTYQGDAFVNQELIDQFPIIKYTEISDELTFEIRGRHEKRD